MKLPEVIYKLRFGVTRARGIAGGDGVVEIGHKNKGNIDGSYVSQRRRRLTRHHSPDVVAPNPSQ
jgi:hypothetical protein